MAETITVKELRFFQCPICTKGHKTKSSAEKCFAKCTEKKLQDQLKAKNYAEECNYIRMNATTLLEVKELLIQKAREWRGAELKFTRFFEPQDFGWCSNSHSNPIGKPGNWCGHDEKLPTKYLGWSSRIKGSINPIEKKYKRISFSEFIEGRRDVDRVVFSVQGFRIGCGGGGDDSFEYSMILWLDDFPKLKEKYDIYKELKEKAVTAEEEIDNRCEMARDKIEDAVENDEEFITITRNITQLEKLKDELVLRKAVVSAQIESKLNYLVDEARGLPKEFDYDEDKLKELQSIFNVTDIYKFI